MIHWQANTPVHDSLLPLVRADDLERAASCCKANTEVGDEGLHPEVPLEFSKNSIKNVLLLARMECGHQLMHVGIETQYDGMPQPQKWYAVEDQKGRCGRRSEQGGDI